MYVTECYYKRFQILKSLAQNSQLKQKIFCTKCFKVFNSVELDKTIFYIFFLNVGFLVFSNFFPAETKLNVIGTTVGF